MTRAEWDALSAREKDGIVAEKVMGFERRDTISEIDGDYLGWLWYQDGKARGSDEARCNWFTERWDAVREVVEVLDGMGALMMGNRNLSDKQTTQWSAHLVVPSGSLWSQKAVTLPEAVCLLALTALGYMEG